MIIEKFLITNEQKEKLLEEFQNLGNNRDIGRQAVEIAKLYFLSKYNRPTFITNKDRIDLSVVLDETIENYEIKGTVDKNIAWSKLKVSSQNCYENLKKGMSIIRISNIGNVDVTLFFMKYNEDFNLIPEPRWSVRKSVICKITDSAGSFESIH